MKTFEQILVLNQADLKAYLTKFLKSYHYKAISDNGFVYAKGTDPVLLVAHMDRHPNHKELVKEIHKQEFVNEKKDTIEMRWSSPQGICGDDRCGVWALMNLMKRGRRPSILFCEDEEIGSVGAGKFCKTEYIKNLEVNYMIQIDRRGADDAVFYSCDTKEFKEWIDKESGFKEKIGTFTDICKLMPESKIAGVNFSCGYYNEHTKEEYIVMEELNQTIDRIDSLLQKESKPYKYEAKKIAYTNYFSNYWDDYDDGIWGGRKWSKSKSKFDTEIKLVVCLEDGSEIESSGSTKPEAWMNLFMENDELSFGMVADYYYE